MEAIQLTNENRTQMFEEAYKGSYYTILGCGGSLQEWVDGYTELLKNDGIGTPDKFITFKGSDMNESYGLEGDSAYKQDLTFLAFPIDGLNTGKLAMFRIKMMDKWFNDIVDNNRKPADYFIL